MFHVGQFGDGHPDTKIKFTTFCRAPSSIDVYIS